MNKVLLASLLSLTIMLFSCKNDKAEQTTEPSQEKETITMNPSEQLRQGELSMQERGLRKLDPERAPENIKIPEPTPQKWAFLTADLWHYEFALTVTDVPENNIYEGYWIDFNDDGTYTKGIYDDVTVEGVFTFDNNTKRLRIYPTKGDDKVREWEILTNGDVIIFVGTNTFGNNSEQIKLARAKSRPVKKLQ